MSEALYLRGDPRTSIAVEERWVVCVRNDVCPFEGDVEVEWQDDKLALFVCPECGREGSYELD